MPRYLCPGLYGPEHVEPGSPPEFCTGVPVFLGYVVPEKRAPQALTHWSQFEEKFDKPPEHGYLAYAVRGFFENGGSRCYVVPMRHGHGREKALDEALRESWQFHDADLVCAPDLFLPQRGHPIDFAEAVRLQAILIRHVADAGDRFAILDSLPQADPGRELEHCAGLYSDSLDWSSNDRPLFPKERKSDPRTPAARRIEGLASSALYYPWLHVPVLAGESYLGRLTGVGESAAAISVPACGHVAGVYAVTDRGGGIQKAPANEALDGVLDVDFRLTDADQGRFFESQSVTSGGVEEIKLPRGAVNCIRAFPGRGIRVWGARTLSREETWRYVNVRRVFLTAQRWIYRYMADIPFEPNAPELWARVQRELNDYCFSLYQRGALRGKSTQEAFYVRCGPETNPQEVRDTGSMVAEIGLAAAQPYEFIVVRLIHRDSGVTFAEPFGAGQI